MIDLGRKKSFLWGVIMGKPWTSMMSKTPFSKMAGDRSFFELGQKKFLHSHFIIKEQQNHLGDHEFSQK